MMEFGKTLRTAREAKGYTVSQLAEMTRLAPSVIENLENEDFSRIAAPIYGRGFVKLYCEAVGLEAKPFVDEFMNIVNGDYEPRIRERSAAPEEPSAAPEPRCRCFSVSGTAVPCSVPDGNEQRFSRNPVHRTPPPSPDTES